MKNIAIFQRDLKIGGIQKSLINFLNNIDYEKYNIDLYLFDTNIVFKVNENVNIIYLKENKFHRFINFNILNKKFKNIINKEYDIAIDYNFYNMDVSLYCLNCKSKRKILWVHNDIDIKLKEEKKFRILFKFFKEKLNKYDEYVCVSKGVKESFNKYINKIDIKVIPNLINTDEIDEKINEKCELNINKDIINICSVGRIIHQKGFDILINDIKELIKYRKDFHLYIIGDGKEKKKIQKLININNLNDYVTITGLLKNPYSLMNEMDTFVIESRYEGQGIVILEALYLGLNIIIPNHLEKYVNDIKGTKNVIESLKNITKKNNNKNNLLSYNKKIISDIEELLS